MSEKYETVVLPDDKVIEVDFDTSKFTLGNLCRRGHEYVSPTAGPTGQTRRVYKYERGRKTEKPGNCPECRRANDAEKRAAEEASAASPANGMGADPSPGTKSTVAQPEASGNDGFAQTMHRTQEAMGRADAAIARLQEIAATDSEREESDDKSAPEADALKAAMYKPDDSAVVDDIAVQPEIEPSDPQPAFAPAPAKKMGRPRTMDDSEKITIRVEREILDELDAWVERQREETGFNIGRSDAIRSFLKRGLREERARV